MNMNAIIRERILLRRNRINKNTIITRSMASVSLNHIIKNKPAPRAPKFKIRRPYYYEMDPNDPDISLDLKFKILRAKKYKVRNRLKFGGPCIKNKRIGSAKMFELDPDNPGINEEKKAEIIFVCVYVYILHSFPIRKIGKDRECQTVSGIKQSECYTRKRATSFD